MFTSMNPRDVNSSKMAEVLVEIGDNRYNLFNIRNFKASIEKLKEEVPVLGVAGTGEVATGWKGTFEGEAYNNSPIFSDLMMDYIQNGKDTYFSVIVTAHTPSNDTGRLSYVLEGCNLDNIDLINLDVEGDFLKTPVSGTFTGVKNPENYKILEGQAI